MTKKSIIYHNQSVLGIFHKLNYKQNI